MMEVKISLPNTKEVYDFTSVVHRSRRPMLHTFTLLARIHPMNSLRSNRAPCLGCVAGFKRGNAEAKTNHANTCGGNWSSYSAGVDKMLA